MAYLGADKLEGRYISSGLNYVPWLALVYTVIGTAPGEADSRRYAGCDSSRLDSVHNYEG